MRNPHRLLVVVVAGAIGLAGVVARRPGGSAVGPEAAATLEAIYALPAERAETHVLQRGETLSGVLARASITGQELADLLLALRRHENPRRLAPGVEVTVRRWVSDGTPRAVEVRLNADSTVRLDRSASGWASRVLVTPTTVDTVYVAGQIEAGRTLYQALVEDADLKLPVKERVQLVGELAEIYAFKLNFAQEIHPGDRYRLIYEREARPDGTARRRRILIAEVQSQGRTYPAIYFRGEEGDGDYYDREGNSLRSGFRRYPVDYVRITSNFNWRRYHPILGIYRAHLGTDFGAAHGTPVKATADGAVAFAGWEGGYGNVIILRHANGYTTRYAHLSRFAAGIRAGRRVRQGQVIGYVGATGLATGPHLHYELRRNGQPIDVRTAKLPGGPPVPKALRSEFEKVVEERFALLEGWVDSAGPRFAAARAERSPEEGT